MPKTQNKKKLPKYTTKIRLSIFIPILLFAIVGAYFVTISHADWEPGESAIEDVNLYSIPKASEVPAGGTTIATPIFSSRQYPGEDPFTTPAQLHIMIISYDTRLFKLVSGNCTSPYGCYATSYDYKTNQDALITNQMHKQKILVCFNVPANFLDRNVPVFTFRFQRTSNPPVDEMSNRNWLVARTVHTDGTCQSNPSGAGIQHVTSTFSGGCNDAAFVSNVCDTGTDPGAGPGLLTGMGGPGTGTGSGGTGTGTNGTGTGPGGGGGGGFSAKKQGDAPNTIPSSTGQGDDKQTELEPSPFFDGKQYEPGSDPDLLGVNTTFSVAGHQLKYGWAYVVGVLILVGGGGGYYLKKNPKLIKKIKLTLAKLK